MLGTQLRPTKLLSRLVPLNGRGGKFKAGYSLGKIGKLKQRHAICVKPWKEAETEFHSSITDFIGTVFTGKRLRPFVSGMDLKSRSSRLPVLYIFSRLSRVAYLLPFEIPFLQPTGSVL